MRALIVAGGEFHRDQPGPDGADEYDLIIGADGGAARALAWGLVPHLVVGDMDSLPGPDRRKLEAQGCEFVEHPRAKDETDLQLALSEAVARGASEIAVWGALGGRLDHLLANVLLLALPALTGASVRIVEGAQEARLLRGGEGADLRGAPGDLVSLLPLGGDAHGVTSEGLAWPLAGDTLRFGFSRGVSNEMTASEARVAVEDGYLLVVRGPGDT